MADQAGTGIRTPRHHSPQQQTGPQMVQLLNPRAGLEEMS